MTKAIWFGVAMVMGVTCLGGGMKNPHARDNYVRNQQAQADARAAKQRADIIASVDAQNQRVAKAEQATKEAAACGIDSVKSYWTNEVGGSYYRLLVIKFKCHFTTDLARTVAPQLESVCRIQRSELSTASSTTIKSQMTGWTGFRDGIQMEASMITTQNVITATFRIDTNDTVVSYSTRIWWQGGEKWYDNKLLGKPLGKGKYVKAGSYGRWVSW